MLPARRALVVPGRNMGPYVPQLLFPTWAAIRRGAEACAIEWYDVDGVDALDPTKVPAWVAARIEPVLEAHADDSIVVIGKSLGTQAAATAATRGLPAIWVTPLLTNAFVLDALSRATAPFLLVGGTADPLWDGRAAHALTPYVLELPGADHGLLVAGPLRLSAQNMAELGTAAERFLDDIVWPSAQDD